jgi:hypothetical protein
MRFPMLGSLLLVVSASACGGKVVYSAGSGGSGGTGTTGTGQSSSKSTGTGTSVTSTSSGTSSSTGIGPDTCKNYCAVVGPCLNAPCDQSCQQALQTPGCQSEAAALIACITQSFDTATCNLKSPNACQAEASAFQQCTSPPPQGCSNQMCTGDGQSCGCDATCFGSPVSTKCTLLPSPQCQCFMNGQLVGSCTQGGGFACAPDTGCCSTFFLPQPGAG